MAVKKTKKLSDQTTTTTVATGEKFAKVDANGKVTLIDLADLKAALLGGLNLNCMLDNVFIMYHKRTNDSPVMVKPHLWPDLQNNEEIADGVVVVEGGRVLVVAPTEASLTWSSEYVIGGTTATGDRVKAMGDWEGKANTASIISKSTSTVITNTAAYAPGFCNLYCRMNANGVGLTAGKWWLPSIGEMAMIYANMNKINYCLSLILGATQLLETWYWASTECTSAAAWNLCLRDGGLSNWGSKTLDKNLVRPVSAFIA